MSGFAANRSTSLASLPSTKNLPKFGLDGKPKFWIISVNGTPRLVPDFALLFECVLSWVLNLQVHAKANSRSSELSSKGVERIAAVRRCLQTRREVIARAPLNHPCSSLLLLELTAGALSPSYARTTEVRRLSVVISR